MIRIFSFFVSITNFYKVLFNFFLLFGKSRPQVMHLTFKLCLQKILSSVKTTMFKFQKEKKVEIFFVLNLNYRSMHTTQSEIIGNASNFLATL